MKNFSLIVKYILIPPGCFGKILECYKVIILFKQLPGIAKAVDSAPGAESSLHKNESSNKYLSANVSVLLIAVLCNSIFSVLNTNEHPWTMAYLNILLGPPLL